MQIVFLYATETGTAEYLCDDLHDTFQDMHQCTVKSMDDINPKTLGSSILYVLVSSTFGSGDVPENGQIFSKILANERPDLSQIRFAIFGLGDSSFGDTFNRGSETLMQNLLACHAAMVGERGIFDASTGNDPEDVATPWLKDILTKYTKASTAQTRETVS